jgi:hypothetical protein
LPVSIGGFKYEDAAALRKVYPTARRSNERNERRYFLCLLHLSGTLLFTARILVR